PVSRLVGLLSKIPTFLVSDTRQLVRKVDNVRKQDRREHALEAGVRTGLATASDELLDVTGHSLDILLSPRAVVAVGILDILPPWDVCGEVATVCNWTDVMPIAKQDKRAALDLREEFPDVDQGIGFQHGLVASRRANQSLASRP